MRVLALAALLCGVSVSVSAQRLAGAYALTDGQPKVTASLTVTPGAGLDRVLDVAMTPIGAAAPVTSYETELTKQMHLIAVSADLRDFVHEHAERPDRDGHFRIPVTFPHEGPWHVYADGVPKGLGQQVMRFDVALGPAPAVGADLARTGPEAADGPFAARFDAIDLKAGDEAELMLHLLRDGKPAPDITPYLGVAAHAVFIDAADLGYVHVHAAPMQHDMAGMEMESMPLAPGSPVPPDLALHVRAPKAGTYVLWIQFEGGGQVRTVRVVVPVS